MYLSLLLFIIIIIIYLIIYLYIHTFYVFHFLYIFIDNLTFLLLRIRFIHQLFNDVFAINMKSGNASEKVIFYFLT